MPTSGDEEAKKDETEFGFRASSSSCRRRVPFRPPERIARQSIVRGPQTAIVVGPKGDEIHTDKHGRVKVQFHWDRVGKKDEKSSCWMRVSQPWASRASASARPASATRSWSSFLEGNPDRPLITGRVYNGEQHAALGRCPTQAHRQSGVRSRSSKGGGADNFNELRFDDKKGSEYVWLQAEKDFHQWVKNDASGHGQGQPPDRTSKRTACKVGENLTLDMGKMATLDIKARHARQDRRGPERRRRRRHEPEGRGRAIAIKGGQTLAITAAKPSTVDGAGHQAAASSTGPHQGRDQPRDRRRHQDLPEGGRRVHHAGAGRREHPAGRW